jgi:DNA-binding LacI/PurR family transcriptional regulator
VNGHTIYDIAQRAGVGIATVSRVINGSSRVAEPTRLAVQRAMQELGFRPNHAARQLAVRGHNRPRVAALMPFFSANFFSAVSRPLSNGLATSNIDLLLYDVQSRDGKNRLLDQILQERTCDGLVLCSMGIGADRQAQLARIGIPVVCVDYPLPGVPSVTVDNRGGTQLAIQHLLETGSSKLAMISSGPATALAFREREDAFLALLGADAPVIRAEGLTLDAGQRAMSQLLTHHRRIDGIVCVDDLLAIGAVQELKSRGRDVPGSVQVIGFDDQPLMDVIGLSTMRQPMSSMGEWAAAAMRDLLARPSDRGAPPVAEQLPVALIHRSTTRTVAKELDRPSLKEAT